jgi:signal transduction histidine kinase
MEYDRWSTALTSPTSQTSRGMIGPLPPLGLASGGSGGIIGRVKHFHALGSRRDLAMDIALAVVVLVASSLGAPPNARQGAAPSWPEPDPVVLLPIVLASVLLVVRRRHSRGVWVGTAVLSLVPVVLAGDSGRGLPAVAVALYTVSAYVDRRWAVGAGLITVVLGTALFLGTADSPLADPAIVAVLPWCALAAALGDTVRSHRLHLADAQQRARVAEETREEEARRRVAEERLRLSRELHDVIGHQLAVINVQAGLAEVLTGRDTAGAIAALEQVRGAASEALSQTSSLVGHLRLGVEAPEAAPAPSLGNLPSLIESVRAGGAEVLWTRRGILSQHDPLVDRHAFRIVQEALTNAVRHGTGPVHLVTEYRGAELMVEVSNGLHGDDTIRRGAPGADGGHGLIGMRERVGLCGGTVSAGRGGGEFAVRVTLPLRADQRESQPTPSSLPEEA